MQRYYTLIGRPACAFLCCSKMFLIRCDGTRRKLHANNKGADQPAQPRSLISAFVIRSLESILSKYFFNILFNLPCLNLTWSQTPKACFLATRTVLSLNAFNGCFQAKRYRRLRKSASVACVVLFPLIKVSAVCSKLLAKGKDNGSSLVGRIIVCTQCSHFKCS